MDKEFNINFNVLESQFMDRLDHVEGSLRDHINKIYFFLFLVKSIHKVLSSSDDNYDKGLIRGLLSGFLYIFYLDRAIRVWSKYINVLISFLCKSQFNVFTRVHVVRNDQITSAFVANFVCKKLRLGFSFRSLINELINEFSKFRSISNKNKRGSILNSIEDSSIYSKKKFLGFYKVIKGHYKRIVYNEYVLSGT